MKVSIAYNKEKKGIELIFIPKLSNPKLEAYLIDLGFKKSRSKADMWYVVDRKSYNQYTQSLQKAFEEGVDPLSIKIAPSYSVSKSNINHKQFSLVTIEIDTDKDDNKIEYVIFEDTKKVALDIATRFANSAYGDKLISVSASPRNYKVKAKNAFDEGRIITGISQSKEGLKETIETGKENLVSPISESLTNDSGVYTKETAGNRYETYTIPFPSKIKFEATIKLVQDEQDLYLYGLSVTNTLSGWGGYSFSPNKVDNTYPSKEEALKAAILQVLDGVQYDHTQAVRIGASEALKKAYKKTILALYDFADSLEIKLPDEKSKAILPLQVDEEESIKKEQTEQKTLNTLNEDVEQIVDELRELETDVDDKGIAFRIGNTKIELDEMLKTTQGKQGISELKKHHSSLIEIADTIPKGKYRTRLFAISERLGAKIGVQSYKNGKNFDFTIIQKHTTIDNTLLADFQSLIELYPNTLHITYLKSKKDGALSILKVRISSDRDTISFLHRKEDNAIKIDGLNPHKEGMVSYNGGAVPMGKLKKAIRYMISNPSTLRIRPAEVYRLSDYVGAIPTDIEYSSKKIPNILLPEGVHSAFDFGKIQEKSKKDLQEEFPKIFDIQDETLIYTIPSQLFTLSQFPDTDKLGIQVNEQSLQSHWMYYGDHLFELLGYPTHMDYPYVNIHTGYRSVSPLGNLIDVERKGNQWWSVVEHNRPIADMQTALQFIDKEIESFTKVRDTFTNPRTGKPKTKQEDKEQYRSLSFKIESFESSKLVIQNYLDTQKEDVPNDPNQDSSQEVDEIANIEKVQKDHFSNMIVPERVIAPFDKGYIVPEEAIQLKEQYFYLFEYTYRTMHRASPVELFMLLQFTHLKESGISVKKEALHRIWEKEGHSLFNQLAYPTALNYPYVSIINGFLEILPLEAIISKLPDVTIWWSAVKHYRPIADVSKALKAITEKQNILAEKLEKFPDTNKTSVEGVTSDNEVFDNLSGDITMLRHSRNHLEAYLKSIPTPDTKDQELSYKEYVLIAPDEADQIRRQFVIQGFPMLFKGKQAFTENSTVFELRYRYELNTSKLEEKKEKEFNKWIAILEKEINKLKGKEDKKSKRSRVHREERILALHKEAWELNTLFEKENTVFRDELFFEFVLKAKAYGYVLEKDDIASFRNFVMENLFQGRIPENYPDEPIGKIARVIIDEFFANIEFEKEKDSSHPDHLDKVVAIMHDHYMEARRLSRKKIEDIKEKAGVPNLGMLWEAVELSWLLWYKMLYSDPAPFDNRLQMLIRFWDKVQPTYAYSDSSKEQYKQYSTPCPISAMISEYTNMPKAGRTFEPSAGNGLLVLGADPDKTHVNEIDNSRRKSLEFQGFKTITHLNAAEPFPEEYTKSFDVVVTNPPFDKWSADTFDKDRIVKKYFDGNIGLNHHLRLEHLMSGLALHTMKDCGKAALIIKGHIKFREDDGYMATYKPFFNWLYSRYVVDDVINMNSYNLYNKQGAVTEMMLILINGRKPKKSKKVAPNQHQAGSLADITDSFEQLWERISSHIKSPLERELEKLKIALGYDIF